MSNPFEVLGLPARPDLTDDDVRSAWRRIAAATHPDREDGGDRARYAQAADAYSRLRTSWDRGEAMAGLSRGGFRRRAFGRPWVLALRVAVAAAVGGGCFAAVGWVPATPAVITGAVTWLVLTGRRDLPG